MMPSVTGYFTIHPFDRQRPTMKARLRRLLRLSSPLDLLIEPDPFILLDILEI